MADTMKVGVGILDNADSVMKGEQMEYEFTMPRDSEVGEVRKKLEGLEAFKGCHFSLNNQLLELEDDDILDEVMDEDDMLTATLHDPRKDPERNRPANIENDSNSIVTIINRRTNKPMTLKAQSTNILNLSALAFLRIITVFRKQYEDEEEKIEKKVEGETVMIGRKYKLPEERDIVKIKITKDGVVKTTMHGDKPIPILDSTQIEMLEGEFHKPYCRLSSFFRGNKISLDFKNNSEDMYILTGTRNSFDAILLEKGEEKRIEVKPQSKKMNEFGLAIPTNRTEEAEVGMREFQAKLFNALQVLKGRKIEIDMKDNQRVVFLKTVDGKRHQLEMTRAKPFKESEIVTRKDLLSWIVPGITEGVTGGIVEKVMGIF